jgi:hypothetical protein
VKSFHFADHHPTKIGGERERLVNRFAHDDKELGPQLGKTITRKNGLEKQPRRDTRALSPPGMFGEKAMHCLAAQKSRPRTRNQYLCAVRLFTFFANGEYELD